jgi:hypothetical protein
MSPHTYLYRVNARRKDYYGEPMNDPSAHPSHVQCPQCGHQVQLRHAMTQAQVRAELSAKTGIPLEVTSTIGKAAGLALIAAWERKQLAEQNVTAQPSTRDENVDCQQTE